MEQTTSIIFDGLDSKSNEAYKALRTNIQFCGNNIKVIAFTSCVPNEGKSSVSFNLAVSFAEDNKKVVLIDADLRRSVLIGRYRVGEIERGLTHYLSGMNSLEEVLYRTDIANLDIIFAGSHSPNPAELLNNAHFTGMVDILREAYDYILIDTPPLGSVIDGAIVARICDGAVLVIEANSINHRFAQNVKSQLEKSNCRILGAVMNKVPVDTKGYYGRYYGKYYGRYGKNHGKSDDKYHDSNYGT